MTKLYLIRHCEAMGNAKRLFQGSTDLDISDMGAVQLGFLRGRFDSVSLDAVYSSPLVRAMKTAAAVVGDKGLEVIPHEGFREINGGIVEGKPFEETFASIPGLADTWNNHPQDFAPEGGEPMRAAYERIWAAVLAVVKKNEGKQVAVATHGGVLRCLFCRLMFNSIERLKEVNWCENTAVSLIEFGDDLTPELKFMNDHTHVPDEYMPKRNRLAAFIGKGAR